MKLVKRISIALLAACVIGGSAVAMTACSGNGLPEDSAYTEAIYTIPEEAPADAIFRNAYLDGYDAKPFAPFFDETAKEVYEYQMLNTTIDDWSVTWHWGWPGEGAPSMNTVQSGDSLVSCRLYYGEKGVGPVTFVYFGFNAAANKLYPVQMTVYDRGKISSSANSEQAKERLLSMVGADQEEKTEE